MKKISKLIVMMVLTVAISSSVFSIKSEAASYTATWTDTYTADEMMAFIMSTNTDYRMVARQIERAIQYGTISTGDVYTLSVKYGVPVASMQILYTDGYVSGYVYKTYAGIAVGAADMADVFDAEYYYNANPDLQAVIGYNPTALYAHFVSNGMAEGRVASANFNPAKYIANYPSLVAAFGNNYAAYYSHYLLTGKGQGLIAK